MTKKVNIGIANAEKLEDGWYFNVMIGPFETWEEAQKFAWIVSELETKQDNPPPLGINVAETISVKDRFGG